MVWTAFGEMLPLAVGLALSPFAIVTGIVLLIGNRGAAKSAAFALGWLVAVLILTAIAYWIVEAVEEADPEHTEDGVNIAQLVFGLLFWVLAVVSWRKRPKDGRPSREVALLDRLSGMTPVKALGLGLAQGALVIKNIPLAFGAGARLGESGVHGWSAAIALLSFAVLATAGVLLPLLVVMVGGQRLTKPLAEARSWLEANLTAITIVVMLMLGGFLVGQGLGILGR